LTKFPVSFDISSD